MPRGQGNRKEPMGTQFTSRLTKLDRRRILEEIQSARQSAVGGAGATLSKQQARAYAREAVRGVLGVAGGRGFLDEIERSVLFEEVLTWLKSLWNDASFNGFSTYIRKYELEGVPSPIPVLNAKLKEITDKYPTDPFRVPISNAAKSVLAKGLTSPTRGETQARAFGRKLATLHVRDVVLIYVSQFLYEAVTRMASMADPYSSSGAVQEFNSLSIEEFARIARRIVRRLDDEGRINDVMRTREITIEELGKLIRP